MQNSGPRGMPFETPGLEHIGIKVKLLNHTAGCRSSNHRRTGGFTGCCGYLYKMDQLNICKLMKKTIILSCSKKHIHFKKTNFFTLGFKLLSSFTVKKKGINANWTCHHCWSQTFRPLSVPNFYYFINFFDNLPNPACTH